MNRRRFLLGGAGLAVAGVGAWVLGHRGLEWEIGAILRRRLSYLTLDPQGVRAFAKDQTAAILGKKIPTWNRLRYHFLASSATSYKRFFRSADRRARRERLEDGIISTYLLSSDFFTGGMDESRTVHYLAYYDAGRPGQNPFARPVVDTPATAT